MRWPKLHGLALAQGDALSKFDCRPSLPASSSHVRLRALMGMEVPERSTLDRVSVH
jgi:hypothetical protein